MVEKWGAVAESSRLKMIVKKENGSFSEMCRLLGFSGVGI